MKRITHRAIHDISSLWSYALRNLMQKIINTCSCTTYTSDVMLIKKYNMEITHGTTQNVSFPWVTLVQTICANTRCEVCTPAGRHMVNSLQTVV